MNSHLSLSSRLKLLTAFGVTAALVSIAFTLVLSWRMEGAGAAINDAGSLRMRTYLMAFKLAKNADNETIQPDIQEFDRILTNLQNGDPKRPLFLPESEEIHEQMEKVVHHWQKLTRPMLFASATHHQPASAETVQNFVKEISRLVHLTELENARDTEWLRLFQTGLMIMVLIGAAVMMVLLYAWVIHPINNLRLGVKAIRAGRFGKKVALGNVAEFAQLADGFNQMGAHLQKLYNNLEQEVQCKTQDLARKNHELETLYQTTRQLHQTHASTEAAQDFLNHVLPQTSASAGSVRLLDFTRNRMDLAASKGLPENLQTAEQCERLEACFCGHAASRADEQIVHFFHKEPPAQTNLCEKIGFKDVAVFHVRHKEQDIGIFTLYFKEETTLKPAETDLLNTLCDQLGLAIANIRLIEENRQLAVLQERNLLAQGLHDSIAQTLTFLNLQVQMLENAMQTGQQEQVQENMNFIKEGVQECYDDVRELLLNFRTKVSRKDFTEAVETLAKRFTQQTHIPAQVNWQGHGLPLSPEQQLQVIFILQESLSNIRKHARADSVEITLQNNQDFILSIHDNGIGFSPERLKAMSNNHVGIGIMHERARRIHADLNIASAPGQSTTITLTLHENKREAT
ncbi:type IV pili methyl-accepting chemotaxis transducer N-terminal domain-containing protein [Neisseria wadsworthii]|uniref:Sensor protein n=1 Tax=Neisseria wadsworthii 9715 TaxID=1030841 RepID=G4CQT4_9NEIS|nr:type IV pili methyl-accepting chemotaxis transducer N-terminal domain-containing protein [Neisseria wadsworthii]EGZ46080.1 nitrate/nitrite sensor histidine kinase NarX [Neisseria wadsworthii 9715]QMT35174.1 type IV pili methyl-accepting chemotaxis transducer N-terminal domain-containing protein [Neisseria wadsworthii]